jgi:hypothetical protein
MNYATIELIIMKHILKQKLVVITFSVLVGMLFTPALASAASQILVGGTASVINTEGELSFEEYNSNVSVDSATGDISGYVWSEDLGWIDFGNNGGTNPVKIDLDNGKVSGLAYVINTEGTVDFTNYNSNTEVDLASGIMSGYGWSEDVGWIDFTGVDLSGTLIETGANILPVILSSIILMAFVIFATVNRWNTTLKMR